MRKLIRSNDISPEVIEAVKKDREHYTLNELVFRYNIAYKHIAEMCKGIERKKTNGDLSPENLKVQR